MRKQASMTARLAGRLQWSRMWGSLLHPGLAAALAGFLVLIAAYAIGFIMGPAQRQIGEMRALGLPLAIYRTPGKGVELETSRIAVAGMGPVAVADKPQNPNAQKLFVNWFFSREGQRLFQSIMRDFQSFRADIPNDDVSEEFRLPPPPDPVYVADADIEAQKKQDFVTDWVRKLTEKLGL